MTEAHPALDREHAHVRRRHDRARPQWGDLTLLLSPAWPGWLFDSGEDDPAHKVEGQSDER